MTSAKAALREAVWAARGSRDATREDAATLAAVIMALPAVRDACGRGAAVTAYASTAGEPATGELLDSLAAAGARVLLPVVRPGRVLAWGSYAGPASLVVSARGIPEPTGVADASLADLAPAVMLVPATAVDRAGRRLGQGGGFYDRALGGLMRHDAGGPLRVAIVHDDEVVHEVPAEGHDERVDLIATPSGPVEVTSRE